MRYLIAAMMAFRLSTAVTAAPVDDIAAKMRAGDYKGITGMMVSKDGALLTEAYAPGYGADKRHDIRSATKSITALLVGELIEDGSLKSVRTKLSKILPEDFTHMPKGEPRRNITVEDALTMRTGLACNDWVPASVGQEDKMYKTRDWGAFFLNLPMAHERGEHFSYCTGGVVYLGRVIEKLSGMPVPDYAEERLFGPMGITGAKWEQTPKGHTDTGGHLRLTLSDLHRIGTLVSNGGEGLVDPKWLEDATSEKTGIYERPERYGYLWWLNGGEVKGQPVSLIYAHGNGGNFIFYVPELSLVAAFTGKNYGDRSQFIPVQILTREIVPSLIDGP